MHRFVVTFALAVLLAIAGTALTKTPDGQPPSKEAPCAKVKGAAFGICNAYCEAQDCDVHARPSCEKLRANYKKLTGNELFPCDRPPCGIAQAPTCDGTCAPGLTCLAGSESGGESGSDNIPTACACAQPCESSQSPTCGGACPAGLVCFAGFESGGESGGDSSAGPCECQLPCGSPAAPECNGACPFGQLCISGPEGGGGEGGADFGGGEGGPEGGGSEFDECFCRRLIIILP